MTTAYFTPIADQPRTPAPVNIWRILLGDDPTLVDDTLALYDRLCSELGQLELGRVIVMDYPLLLKPECGLLKTWWLLSNIADARARLTAPAQTGESLQAQP